MEKFTYRITLDEDAGDICKEVAILAAQSNSMKEGVELDEFQIHFHAHKTATPGKLAGLVGQKFRDYFVIVKKVSGVWKKMLLIEKCEVWNAGRWTETLSSQEIKN